VSILPLCPTAEQLAGFGSGNISRCFATLQIFDNVPIRQLHHNMAKALVEFGWKTDITRYDLKIFYPKTNLHKQVFCI
jgi:hypothetical protein